MTVNSLKKSKRIGGGGGGRRILVRFEVLTAVTMRNVHLQERLLQKEHVIGKIGGSTGARLRVCVYSVFMLSHVQVATSQRADPPSKESYQLCKRSNKGL
jgi:hypothetical protein